MTRRTEATTEERLARTMQGEREHPNPEVPHVPWNGLRQSRNPEFVDDMSVLLRAAGGEVYAASSWSEYSRLQEEGVVVEMCVVDPVFRVE